MACGLVGQILTPAAGNRLTAGVEWIADNSVFGGKYPGDDAYLDWLSGFVPHADRCRFVVAPDVVGDAELTWKRSAPMLGPIRMLGYQVAYVAQNGATPANLPWGRFDALFLGGDTAWKLSHHAADVTGEAHQRGVPVHMGRVNSLKRLRYADRIGCASADGTYLAFGPDRNLPTLLAWLREVNGQRLLWERL
jgi:hypothetical protein